MKYTLFLIFTFALLAACTSTPVVTKKREDPNSFPAWQARHKQEVEQFLQYLAAQDVLKILPPEQLLRSASDWEKCNAEPFAVPPRQRWSDAVSVLRLLRYLQLTGVIGSVEVYSAYRNPSLNICAGGAEKSAHARSFALDFRVQGTVDPTDALCDFWRTQGALWNMGYTRYPSGRIHIDTAGYRTWGIDPVSGSVACRRF